jgi:Domain of unknown function (DUF4331)
MNKKNILLVSLFSVGAFSACGGGSDSEDFTQRDRMGMPAVNTALISSGNKDAFNQGDPSTDQVDFKDLMLSITNGLRSAVGAVPGFPGEDADGVSAETVVSLVNPDVIHLDLSKADGFPNGRTLTDDTINPTLGLVLNRGNVLGGGPGISDAIDTPSQPLATFPYAGNPNP